jgi:hypothetical protein
VMGGTRHGWLGGDNPASPFATGIDDLEPREEILTAGVTKRICPQEQNLR